MWKRRCYICILCVLLCLSGCSFRGNRNTQTQNAAEEKKLKIVTTIFPVYDWTREIVGEQTDGIELTLLLDQGVDMHSYQPTVDDIITIGSCDLFIYVGGESDAWVEEVLEAAVNPDMKVINLLEVLGERVKEEEVVEGMESGHDHHEEEHGQDEHVWLSLKNAKELCSAIAGALSELDEEHVTQYAEHVEAYGTQLEELDEQFQKMVEQADKHTLVFADRFPFRYLTDDYGLEYYAAFPGCEAETEASFETITFLAGKLDELKLSCVLTIEGSDQKIAKTVAANTKQQNQKILSLDSMQSVTKEEIADGATYLSVMEHNRKVLERALSGE